MPVRKPKPATTQNVCKSGCNKSKPLKKPIPCNLKVKVYPTKCCAKPKNYTKNSKNTKQTCSNSKVKSSNSWRCCSENDSSSTCASSDLSGSSCSSGSDSGSCSFSSSTSCPDDSLDDRCCGKKCCKK